MLRFGRANILCGVSPFNWAYVFNPLAWVDPLGLAGEAHEGKGKDATKRAFPTKFHKRSVEEVAQLRKEFESIKPEFVRSYANSAEAAKRFTPQQIAKMTKSGKIPKGFVIHHKKPLFRGGQLFR